MKRGGSWTVPCNYYAVFSPSKVQGMTGVIAIGVEPVAISKSWDFPILTSREILHLRFVGRTCLVYVRENTAVRACVCNHVYVCVMHSMLYTLFAAK